MTATRPATILAALVLAAALGACSSGGGGGALSSGLTARMDQPGANLNRAEALSILNHYRATAGANPLVADSGLDVAATDLAASYARLGNAPQKPAGAVGMRVSAGYPNFAETFSGWRNSPADAAILAERSATRAGLGVAYDPNSTYGVYWVLILED